MSIRSFCFVYRANDVVILLVVYIDDIVLIGNNGSSINVLKAYLPKKIDIKDLGLLRYFLDIKFAQSSYLFFPNKNML